MLSKMVNLLRYNVIIRFNVGMKRDLFNADGEYILNLPKVIMTIIMEKHSLV